jgi:hypothetical protein
MASKSTASRTSSFVRDVCQVCAQSHAAPTRGTCLSPPCLVSTYILRQIGAGGTPARGQQRRRT